MTEENARSTGRQPFEDGSGNVFADLALPAPEDLLAKARLAEAIDDAIRRRELTQEQAAGIMDVDQGTVSRVVNGHLDGFSQDRLIRYLTALGVHVEIVLRSGREEGGRGHLTVRVPTATAE